MSVYRKIYPGTQPILFDGGLNNKYERAIIQDNESPDCLNVIFNNGAVETRQGTTKLNTAAIGSFVGDGLYTRLARDGSETMVACAGGTVWDLQGTSFITIGSAQSLFTAGFRFAGVSDENYLFLSNGGQIAYKWNGTEFTRHGVYPPTNTSTVASNAIGGLTGDYRYKVTYVNSNLVESDVGPPTATFTAAAAQLRVTNIPTAAASYGVNSRKLYRTAAGGATYKLVTTISDNTTTQYDDSTADGSLGATAPTDNGVPPLYNAAVYHPAQSRIFMNDTSNQNRVYWTEIGQPYTVQSTSFKLIGDNTSDLVRGFEVLDNALYVFCDNSISIAYMADTTPSNWKWITIRAPFGSKSPYGIVKYKNKILFPAYHNKKFVGFAAIEGSSIDQDTSLLTVSTAGSDLKSDRIEPEMFNIQESYTKNISAIAYKNKVYIAATYGSSNTTNNRFYYFDYSISNLKKSQLESWSPNTGLNPAQFTVYGGNLYYISSTATGFVYKMEAGVYSDDGSAINSYYWTKEYAGYAQDINWHKDFRYMQIMVKLAGSYYMDLTYRTNSDSGSGNSILVDLTPGGSLWNSFIWGVGNWSAGYDQKEYRISLGAAAGKRIQFKFSNRNTANQMFKVYRAQLTYNLRGYR